MLRSRGFVPIMAHVDPQRGLNAHSPMIFHILGAGRAREVPIDTIDLQWTPSEYRRISCVLRGCRNHS
jgi:hypothetical protein